MSLGVFAASADADDCCSSPVQLGFSTTSVSSPAPFDGIVESVPGTCSGGGTIVYEVRNCRPFTGTAHVFASIGSNLDSANTGGGVQGWSLSIALEGDIEFGPGGVTTSGTSVDLYHAGGFMLASVVDSAKNGGHRGAITAVTLSRPESQTLPATGTESVLDLELVPASPVREAGMRGELSFRDGLMVSGEPVDNYITVNGQPLRACNTDTASVHVNFFLQLTVHTFFLRGNSNGDSRLDIADAVWILSDLFSGGSRTACPAASDANGDDRIDISDAAFILGYLFLGGSPPPPPYPECDEDGNCRPSSLYCYVDQPGCR